MKLLNPKYYLYIIILILLLPAQLINLGVMPLSADEATRALVALEMKFSGNLITPTINGEYYFNKPPLYNWLLLGLFEISGNASEWIIRIPVVIFLLAFGVIIYLGSRKITGEKVSFISAMALITCGRILFYDSMRGLIDTSFSFIVFINFLLIFKLLKKEKYLQLFVVSYTIAAVGFLMKGLPSIVFQGITIITALFFFKKPKKLFSFQHLSGIILFLVITGSYYFAVWLENPTKEYFLTLLIESTKRTFIEYGFWSTVLHLFTFPLEQFYHLLPWSILGIYLFDKRFYRNIRENSFLSFLALIFIVNIPVYWLSPETYPRYLFMLYPILLILLVNHHFYLRERAKKLALIIEWIFLGLLILIIPAVLTGLFIYPFEYERSFFFPFLFIGLTIMASILLFMRMKKHRFEIIVISLLLMRITFNWVVIPERHEASRETEQRKFAKEVAGITENQTLLLDNWTGISHETSFYITKYRGKILSIREKDFQPGIWYIRSDRNPLLPGEQISLRFETRWENRPLRLVTYINPPGGNY